MEDRAQVAKKVSRGMGELQPALLIQLDKLTWKSSFLLFKEFNN